MTEIKKEEVKLILISGGIGAGKSVVSRILRLQGHKVYDCDCEARRLMNNDEAFKLELCNLVDERIIDSQGQIISEKLSPHVFGKENVREWVNKKVHAMVREDLSALMNNYSDDGMLFVESAIPVCSGLVEIANGCILVVAPDELRIHRVNQRSGLNRCEIIQRMQAQTEEQVGLIASGIPVYVLDNNGHNSVLQSLERIIGQLKSDILALNK